MVTAHEAAHQWWGNLLTPGEGPGTSLLSEGMAHYSTALLFEKVKGPNARMEFLKRIEERYGNEAKQVEIVCGIEPERVVADPDVQVLQVRRRGGGVVAGMKYNLSPIWPPWCARRSRSTTESARRRSSSSVSSHSAAARRSWSSKSPGPPSFRRPPSLPAASRPSSCPGGSASSALPFYSFSAWISEITSHRT